MTADDRGAARLPFRPGHPLYAPLVFLAFLLLAIGAWRLADVLLLVFAAVLVAVILDALASLVSRGLPLGPAGALAVAVSVILLLIGVSAFLFGQQVLVQADDLVRNLPDQFAELGTILGIDDLPGLLISGAQAFAERADLVQNVAGYTTGMIGAAASLLLVLAGAVYLAAQPDLYREGALRLFPRAIRARIARASSKAAAALRLWLLGQLMSMVLVGTLTTIGLYLIGIPSPLALGLLAGLAEFIPLAGPFFAAVPALVIAFAEGWSAVAWVLVLYIAVQQIESNVLMPLIQHRVARLPPALALFALVVFAVLFGPLGILLATPLAVVAFVGVKELYVRDYLEDGVPSDPPPGGRP